MRSYRRRRWRVPPGWSRPLRPLDGVPARRTLNRGLWRLHHRGAGEFTAGPARDGPFARWAVSGRELGSKRPRAPYIRRRDVLCRGNRRAMRVSGVSVPESCTAARVSRGQMVGGARVAAPRAPQPRSPRGERKGGLRYKWWQNATSRARRTIPTTPVASPAPSLSLPEQEDPQRSDFLRGRAMSG
jgi:hypothetical protein